MPVVGKRHIGYTLKEVAALTEIKPQTIAFYANEGLVVPDVDNPKGKGTTRRFSKVDMVEILLIRELAKHGVSLSIIKLVIKGINEKYFIRATAAASMIEERVRKKLANIIPLLEQEEVEKIFEEEKDKIKQKSLDDMIINNYKEKNKQIFLYIIYDSKDKVEEFLVERDINKKSLPFVFESDVEEKIFELENGFYYRNHMVIDITEIIFKVANV
jgi:DNA-binding transcriptional MerR regulator